MKNTQRVQGKAGEATYETQPDADGMYGWSFIGWDDSFGHTGRCTTYEIARERADALAAGVFKIVEA